MLPRLQLILAPFIIFVVFSDPSEDKSVFGGRAAAEAAAEEAEANQDWTSIRGSRSASGPGFAGASAPTGPSQADDSSNWTSLRGSVRRYENSAHRTLTRLS